MQSAFINILIPVDFTANTDVAVKKAIDLIDKYGSVVHLFHVKNEDVFKLNIIHVKAQITTPDKSICSNTLAEAKLLQWKQAIKETLPQTQVKIEVQVSSNVEQAIINKAQAIGSDLIVLGKQSCHIWLPFLNTVSPDKIAKETGCPVLTVKPGAIMSKIKFVVIPVADFMPMQKLKLIAALHQKFRLRVHLVTVINQHKGESSFSSPALIETFRYLKDLLRCPVEYSVVHGDNRARAVLQYAQDVNADILLVNPEIETKLSGFTNKHIIDVLRPQSRLQVLTVKAN